MTMPPLSRRGFLAASAVIAVLAIIPLPASAAVPGAETFMKNFADQMVAIVNGPQPHDAKKAALAPVIDANVDVPTIARFCLGRAWNTATPAQQEKYVTLFHQWLLNDIAAHLGDYQGVSYTLTGTHPQGGDALVGTSIVRPNAPVADVQWVISTVGGAPKVVDVVAEGTSMRLTQRQDYASYLRQHGNDLDALLAALGRQLSGG
jgi:phospholipid transport system substrate-binding protein